MKILEVEQVTCFSVETEEEQYIRYGPYCWYVIIGESEEPVYDCEELERLFQEFVNKKRSSVLTRKITS